MATLVLGAAGAAVGAAFGNPQLGFSIGVTLAGVLFPPKQAAQERGRLDDLRLTASGYGAAIPVVYGAGRVGGNILWATDLVEHVSEERVGGKGGGGGQKVRSYTYSASFAVAVCRGPVKGIKRIWAEDRLIWESGTTDYTIRVHLGAEDQLPDTLIEAKQGAGQTPAYRGTVYVVFEDMDLSPWGNRLPALNFEIEPFVAETSALHAWGCPTRNGYRIKPDGACEGWGINTGYELGLGDATDRLSPVPVGTNVAAIGSVTDGGFGAWGIRIHRNGDLYATGGNYQGQFGNGATSSTALTTWTLQGNLGGVPVKQLSLGKNAAMVLLGDGTVKLAGGTFYLGTSVSGQGGANLTTFTQIHTGVSWINTNNSASLVVTTGGALKVVGYNIHGRFGLGHADNSTTWQSVNVTGVKQAFLVDMSVPGEAGGMLVLKQDGTVWFAGHNARRMFGDAALSDSYTSSTLRQVPGLPAITSIFANQAACYALDEAGAVWVWGDNAPFASGTALALGNGGDPRQILTPTKRVEGGAAAVWGYQRGGLVVKSDNSVQGWGDNADGSLGTGSRTNVTTPAVLPWAAPSSGGTTVASILSDVATGCGMAAGDYDFSAATDPVDGFLVAQRKSGSAVLSELLPFFALDLVEIDGKIKAVKRGGSTLTTIAAGDLGARAWDGSEPASRLETRRVQDLELPARLDLTYFSKGGQYQQASQGALRQSATHVQDAVTLNTALVLSDTAARQGAERLLYTQWRERDFYGFTLPPRYLALAPGDLVSLPAGSGAVRARILAVDVGLFDVLKLSAVRDDPAVLTQYAQGAALLSQTPVLLRPGETTFWVWDGNGLRDADADTVGIYLAATGAEGWGGCVVYLSRDGGQSWQVLETLADPATGGSAMTALSAGLTTGLWQEGATLDVSLVRGTVESTGQADVLAGANAALLGDEVLQFTTAAPLAPGQWRLGGLLRGRRGTDAFWGTHAAGERFVLLTPGTVKRVTLPEDLAGKTVLLKAVGAGKTLAQTAAVSLPITGASLRPYAPCQVAGSRDGGQNLTITWVRRTRTQGEMRDGSDVPLGETSERYDVEILNGSGAVVRTLAGLSSPSAGYSAADQTADFGAAQPSVSVRIYQLGKLGRGYAAQASL